eukprot:CAMPEP_0117697082 /NCGR_PEP_ID=MMETSP0804-20121206/29029_1 /TAXON_ID=1074897 /ORGANISM="Tetraselmis astigmatica, Strain CCMP880" /LENGTH=578 /DNA_ID=CAMNT_0005511289 /DNA_START=1 /DNA_END=1739 /DNA_ORIENTATION=-
MHQQILPSFFGVALCWTVISLLLWTVNIAQSQPIDGNSREPAEPECLCAAFYVPVCGANNITYSNTCWASCAGLLEGEWSAGECGRKPPSDTDNGEIVCGHISNCAHVGQTANFNVRLALAHFQMMGMDYPAATDDNSQCSSVEECPGRWIPDATHCPPDPDSTGGCDRVSLCEQVNDLTNYNKKGIQTCGWCQLEPVSYSMGLPCDTDADGQCIASYACSGRWVTDVGECAVVLATSTPTPTPTPTPFQSPTPTPDGSGTATPTETPYEDLAVIDAAGNTTTSSDTVLPSSNSAEVSNSSSALSEGNSTSDDPDSYNMPDSGVYINSALQQNETAPPEGGLVDLHKDTTPADNIPSQSNHSTMPVDTPDIAMAAEPQDDVASCSECYGMAGPSVCGIDRKTYMNLCEAACMGIQVGNEGDCFSSLLPRKPADHWTMACLGFCRLAEPTARPVCGADGVTYKSECEAHCHSASIAALRPCECGCADDGRVVTAERKLISTGARGCSGPNGPTGQGWCYTAAPCSQDTEDVVVPGLEGAIHTVSIRQCESRDFFLPSGQKLGSTAATTPKADGNRKISP